MMMLVFVVKVMMLVCELVVLLFDGAGEMEVAMESFL